MNFQELSLLVQSLILVVIPLSIIHIDDGSERRFGWLFYSSLAAALVSFLLTMAQLIYGVSTVEIFSGTLELNASGYILSLAAEFSTLVVLIGSQNQVRSWSARSSFISLVLLTLLGVIYLSFASNVLVVVTSWALASAATYAISMIVKDPKSVDGGIKYLIMGIVSSSIMIFGFAFLVSTTGTLSLLDPLPSSPPFLELALIFLVVAFSFKIGAFPFHAWLPDVYTESDRIVVSFVSSVGKVIGIAALLRVLLALQLPGSISFLSLVILSLISLGSMFFGNFVAFSRRTLSSILAFSSISQAGFLFIGYATLLTSTSSIALAGIAVQTVAYVVAQAGLFLFVSYVERVKGSDEISALNGLYGANRWLAFSSTILLVSLLGIPPLAGFWGKLFLFEASANYPILLVLGLLNSAISAGYYLVIMREIFREGQYTKVESTEVDGVHIAAVVTILIGILAPIIFETLV
jgi:NADH-quinone oxidoreductase subunit N